MNNFITLFNYNFLPQGLAMINSLKKNSECFISIVCLDDEVFNFLQKKDFDFVELIKVKDLEKIMKYDYRNQRSFIEYCWMLTPFLFKFIFERDRNIKQLTYVDADVFFFKSLNPILEEFKLSNKDIYITEHGYHKNHDKTDKSGKFCVQFLTFKNNNEAEKVRNEWEQKCIESTAIDYKKNIVGDQKYFDDLYSKYSKNFCVSKNLNFYQAPWTLNRFKPEEAILFHFHSLRIEKKRIRLFSYYDLEENIITKIYFPYLKVLKKILEENNLYLDQTALGEKPNIMSKLKNVFHEILYRFNKKKKFNTYLDLNRI